MTCFFLHCQNVCEIFMRGRFWEVIVGVLSRLDSTLSHLCMNCLLICIHLGVCVTMGLAN